MRFEFTYKTTLKAFVRTDATGAQAPFNFEQQVPGTRPEMCQGLGTPPEIKDGAPEYFSQQGCNKVIN